MYFMAVKKSRKQVLFSDFNIHIQKTVHLKGYRNYGSTQ